MMLNELSVVDGREDNTVIVSIPRGKRSKRVYGFDQSDLICEELSRISRLPYFPIIKRSRDGKEQKGLDSKRRFRNVRSLFSISDPNIVKGKYVVLFDDVVTTGASMSACVEILQKAGARGIFCLCMAQVPQNTVK